MWIRKDHSCTDDFPFTTDFDPLGMEWKCGMCGRLWYVCSTSHPFSAGPYTLSFRRVRD